MVRSRLLLGAALVLPVAVLIAMRLAGDGTSRAENEVAPRGTATPPAEREESRVGPRHPLTDLSEPVETAPEPPATFLATGFARDLEGRPAVGVALAAAGDGPTPSERAPRGTTAADGSFTIAVPRGRTHVVSADPRWTVVQGGGFHYETPALELVVAPRGTWTGRVVDRETGAPVVGARVRAVSPIHAMLADPAEPLAREVQAGSDGSFTLADVALAAETRVEVIAPEYHAYVAEPGMTASDLGVIALAPGTPSAVRGVVRQADGSPAVGATVALGDASTTTGSDGAFTLFVQLPAPGASLVARAAGLTPARAAGVGDELLRGDVGGVELELGDAGWVIEGRVVDGDGAALKRWSVEVLDERGAQVGFVRRTRKDGVFRVEGLGEGPYTVVGRGRESEELAVIAGVHAPRAGLELVQAGPTRAISGTVIDADGTPAARAEVAFLAAGLVRTVSVVTATDAAGRFTLEDVPRVPGELVVTPTSLAAGLPRRLPIGTQEDGSIEAHLSAARHLRFEATDPAEAPDALFVLDPAGRPAPIRVGGREQAALRLDAGRSGVFAAPADVRVLVLTRFGREVSRLALPPAAGRDVHVVRL